MRRINRATAGQILKGLGFYSEDEIFRSEYGGSIVGQTSDSGFTPPPIAPQDINRNSFTLYPFSISNTSGTNGSNSIVPANQRRTFLLVQNQSASATLYFNLSGDAGLNAGVQLAPGVGVFFDIVCPYNAVSVYMDSATAQPGCVVEGALII